MHNCETLEGFFTKHAHAFAKAYSPFHRNVVMKSCDWIGSDLSAQEKLNSHHP